jgi:hypothetical protein
MPASLLDARSVMQLQRTIGNAATTEFLQHSQGLQRCAEDGLINGTCLECGKSVPVVQKAGDAGVSAPPDAGSAAPGAPGTTDAGTPTIAIARQGQTDRTFISTDQLSFTAQVTGGAADAASHVTWTVTGVSSDAHNGQPHTAANTANFSFKPNPTNRPTAGSRAANPPIQYRVKAQIGNVSATSDLEQDETDIIRQEYADYGQPVPARDDFIAANQYNTGNYRKMLDDGIDGHFTGAQSQYQTLSQQAAQPAQPAPQAGGAGGAQQPAPQAAAAGGTVGFASAYRNPQRNKAVGSTHPESRHTRGQAIDLTVTDPDATRWARLKQAGANAGNPVSICEHGGTQVECNAGNVDHVHIQWN